MISIQLENPQLETKLIYYAKNHSLSIDEYIQKALMQILEDEEDMQDILEYENNPNKEFIDWQDLKNV